MAVGDHVCVHRLGYTHHGVEVYDGMVVHFTGSPGSKRGAMVRLESMETFAHGAEVHIKEYAQRLDAADTVELAESKVDTVGYNLYGNNCEHLARWCVTGDHKSSQVNAAKATAGVGTTAAIAAGEVGVVSAIGITGGLSGAGIMSGLAAAGSTVGAGAVGGLVVLGLAPGALSATVMNVALRDDQSLKKDERSARSVGRKASIAGVVGGSAAGVATVSAAGATAGLSAAGISSGLATIGALAGGGMAAGSAIVIAGPAVAAAGVGYGAYRATRRIRVEASKEHPRMAKALDQARRRASTIPRPRLRRRAPEAQPTEVKVEGRLV